MDLYTCQGVHVRRWGIGTPSVSLPSIAYIGAVHTALVTIGESSRCRGASDGFTAVWSAYCEQCCHRSQADGSAPVPPCQGCLVTVVAAAPAAVAEAAHRRLGLLHGVHELHPSSATLAEHGLALERQLPRGVQFRVDSMGFQV